MIIHRFTFSIFKFYKVIIILYLLCKDNHWSLPPTSFWQMQFRKILFHSFSLANSRSCAVFVKPFYTFVYGHTNRECTDRPNAYMSDSLNRASITCSFSIECFAERSETLYNARAKEMRETNSVKFNTIKTYIRVVRFRFFFFFLELCLVITFINRPYSLRRSSSKTFDLYI